MTKSTVPNNLRTLIKLWYGIVWRKFLSSTFVSSLFRSIFQMTISSWKQNSFSFCDVNLMENYAEQNIVHLPTWILVISRPLQLLLAHGMFRIIFTILFDNACPVSTYFYLYFHTPHTTERMKIRGNILKVMKVSK